MFNTRDPQSPSDYQYVGPTRFAVNAWYAGPTPGTPILGGEKQQPTLPASTPNTDKPAEELELPNTPEDTPSEIHHVTDQQENNDLLVLISEVNGHPVLSLIDSGASDNFIDHAWAVQHGLPIQQHDRPYTTRVRLANGSIAKTTGTVNCELTCGNWSCSVTFEVLKLSTKRPVILGTPWLK